MRSSTMLSEAVFCSLLPSRGIICAALLCDAERFKYFRREVQYGVEIAVTVFG